MVLLALLNCVLTAVDFSTDKSCENDTCEFNRVSDFFRTSYDYITSAALLLLSSLIKPCFLGTTMSILRFLRFGLFLEAELSYLTTAH